MVAAALGTVLAAAGCQGNSPPADPAPPPPASRPAVIRAVLRPPEEAPVVQLDVLQIAVPRGAVSRSDEFWKRVDEGRIDPPTYDLLLKNGVRVGLAPIAAWGEYYKELFDQNNPIVLSGSVTAAGSGAVELLMRGGVLQQDIWRLNDRNEVEGRTYTKCDNLLEVSFWPERRKPGALRLTVTPMVRLNRVLREFTLRNDQRDLVERHPEFLYDLNLTTTIPADSFLVLAPSPESRVPDCLGDVFLILNGDAEQRENVLVFVPRTVRPGDPSFVTPVVPKR